MTHARASTTTVNRPPLSRRQIVLVVTLGAAVLVSSIAAFVYSPCLQLVVASSNEKSDLLKDLIRRYPPPRVERRCVDVTIRELSSGTAERALADDWKGMSGPAPAVWSPASKTWLLLLDEDRRIAKLPPIVPAVAESFIQSPLVIAMPEPMATALRQSTQSPGWQDLVTLERDPAGWARFGKPWGAFKFAQTTPFISTSGLHAMISIDNAAHAAQAEADPDEFVRDLDSSVLHYADSVRTFLKSLYEWDGRHAALSYVSAIAVEEKQVFDYNRGNPNSDVCTKDECGRIPEYKLVALYPRDGTLYADHPYAILKWPGQADAELLAQAARDFQTFLEAKEQQDFFKSQGFRDDRTQAGPELAQPYFDPNEPTHLWAVPRATAVQQLRLNWKDEIRKPANAILLLDTSDGSQTKLELAKGAIVNTLDELSKRDAIGIRTFPTETGSAFREVLEIGPLGRPPIQFAASVNGVRTERGKRSLYSTIRAAAERVRAQYSSQRVNAVVLVTSGGDESADRLDALTAWFEQQTERRVLLFIVALPSAPVNELRTIVSAAGGILYEVTSTTDIEEFIRRALLNL